MSHPAIIVPSTLPTRSWLEICHKKCNFHLRAHADDDVVTKSAGWCGMRIQDERILSITDHKGMPFAVQLHTHSTPAAACGRKNKANNPESACAYRLRGAGGGLRDSPPALMRHLSVDLRGLSRLGMELGIPSSYAASVQHLRTTELHLGSDGSTKVMGKTTAECAIAHIIESRHGLLAHWVGGGSRCSSSAVGYLRPCTRRSGLLVHDIRRYWGLLARYPPFVRCAYSFPVPRMSSASLDAILRGTVRLSAQLQPRI